VEEKELERELNTSTRVVAPPVAPSAIRTYGPTEHPVHKRKGKAGMRWRRKKEEKERRRQRQRRRREEEEEKEEQ
jgi:hypothetical protein